MRTLNLTKEEIETIISVIQDWYSSPFSDFTIPYATKREKAVMDIHDKLEKYLEEENENRS